MMDALAKLQATQERLLVARAAIDDAIEDVAQAIHQEADDMNECPCEWCM